MTQLNANGDPKNVRASTTLSTQLSSFVRNAQLLNGVGITAAAVLFVCVNVLSARFFQRWDATQSRLYTLSEPTRALLSRLQQPLEVVVLLSRTDPLTHTVSKVLDEYRAISHYVQPRFVDPDRNPAEFVALQQRYGLLEGRTEEGRVAADASIVLAQNGQHWFVTTSDIVAYDEQTDQATPRLERVLTEGIARVIGQTRQVSCFTRGHQELGAASGGPQGLAEFRRQLERNNYEVKQVDLGAAQPAFALRGCDVVLAIGAGQRYTRPAAQELSRHLKAGGGIIVAVGPLNDDSGRITDTGLSPLLEPLGIRSMKRLVFEGDQLLTMPIGIGGEVFLASPSAHAVTSGLLRGNDVQFRVLLKLTQAFERTDSSVAQVLLQSSPSATSVESFRSLGSSETPGDGGEPQVYEVALAAEHPNAGVLDQQRDQANKPRRGRLVVIGTPSALWSSTWREPALLGTRRFVENALSWVSASQPLVSVPEKAAQPAGLALTEAGVNEVRRYVLLYMPISAALVGLLLVWQRRREATREARR